MVGWVSTQARLHRESPKFPVAYKSWQHYLLCCLHQQNYHIGIRFAAPQIARLGIHQLPLSNLAAAHRSLFPTPGNSQMIYHRQQSLDRVTKIKAKSPRNPMRAHAWEPYVRVC